MEEDEILKRAVRSMDSTVIRTPDEAEARVIYLTKAAAEVNESISQELGKVLGYPWYKDNQEIFPGATIEDGVCVGDAVAESLAVDASKRILELEKALRPFAQFEYLEDENIHDNVGIWQTPGLIRQMGVTYGHFRKARLVLGWRVLKQADNSPDKPSER